MTVAELIGALHRLPPDLRVLVDGYEGGLDDPRPLSQVSAIRAVHRSCFGWYWPTGEEYGDTVGEPFDAVVIPR